MDQEVFDPQSFTPSSMTPHDEGSLAEEVRAAFTSASHLFIVQLITVSIIAYAQYMDRQVSRIRSQTVDEDESSVFYNVTSHQFQNTIKPFTVLRIANRQAASPYYLSTSNLSSFEIRARNFFFSHYLHFHASYRRNNTAPALVFRPHPSGLGDMFNFLVYSYFLAVLSRRILLIDWVYPFPISHFFDNAPNSMTDFFYRTGERATIPSVLSLNSFPNETSKVGDGFDFNYVSDGGLNRHERAYINDMNGVRPEVVENLLYSNVQTVFIQSRRLLRSHQLINMAKRHLPNDFREQEANSMVNLMNELHFHRIFAHHVLHVSTHMQQDVTEMCQILRLQCGYNKVKKSGFLKMNYLKDWSWIRSSSQVVAVRKGKSTKYISVHARLGVGVGEMTHHRFRKLAGDFVRPARCLASRAVKLSFINPDGPIPIFLATDSPSFRPVFKQAVSLFSGGQVNVRHGQWDVTHSNYDSTRRGIPRKNGLWASCMDLLLIGHAEHVLSLYSSFPRFAVAVGDSLTLTELRPEICDGY